MPGQVQGDDEGGAEGMNVYFVSAGEVTTFGPGEYDPPETSFLVELVAAPTRSAATYDMWRKYERDLGDLTECRWETKLIAKNQDRARGLLDWGDPLWRTKEANMPLCLPVPGSLRP